MTASKVNSTTLTTIIFTPDLSHHHQLPNWSINPISDVAWNYCHPSYDAVPFPRKLSRTLIGDPRHVVVSPDRRFKGLLAGENLMGTIRSYLFPLSSSRRGDLDGIQRPWKHGVCDSLFLSIHTSPLEAFDVVFSMLPQLAFRHFGPTYVCQI